MTDVEKLILEKLDNISKELQEVREETSLARKEASLAREEASLAREESSLARKEASLAREEASLARKEASLASQKSDQANEQIALVKDMVLQTQLLIENEISRKINIIGDGHDFLKMRLEEALRLEKVRERMELEIMDLRMEVKKIKAHFQIA